MDKKQKIAVVAGGFSGESIVSLKSAETIMNHIDRAIYEPFLVKILDDKWRVEFKDVEKDIDKNDFSFLVEGEKVIFDFAFIIIHGTPGEDGFMQAYFDLIKIPYNTGDSVNMGLTFDKGYTQRMLKGMGFNVAKHLIFHKDDVLNDSEIESELGFPCFVKPVRSGSSIGISKVNSKDDLHLALEKAFEEHHTIIVEENLEGLEITCGVYELENKKYALPVTEIVSANDFFDFDAKYNRKDTQEITPARISDEIREKCQWLSKEVYAILGCQGLVRVDYMLVNNTLFIIELNTVPGMSAESIIPKQLKAQGIEIKEMISLLINEKLKRGLLV